MVGLTELIPNPFGGFAPFPNSIMIPFMGTQSAVLGYDFGLSYEAGKRMIKSMDNVDFNKFIKQGNTIEFEGKQQNLLSVFSKKHYRNMVQEFTSRIPSSLALQDTIIEASVAIELKKANRTPSAMVEIIAAFAAAGGTTVKDNLDKLPDNEKAFILTAVPILALIYALAGSTLPTGFTNTGIKEPEPPPIIDTGLEHTEIIGHEQHPFHSDNEPLVTPEEELAQSKEPEPPINELDVIYHITFNFLLSNGTRFTYDINHKLSTHIANITFWTSSMNTHLKLGTSTSLKLANDFAKKLWRLRQAIFDKTGKWY